MLKGLCYKFPEMRRYLGLSLFLHFLIFVIFIYRKTVSIDDPIVSVSLHISSANKTAAASPKSASQKPTVKSESKNSALLEQKPNAREENSSNLTSAPLESGNVSVKPRVMKPFQILYPQQAKDARIEGAVKLSVVVNEAGQVEDVKVLEGPGYGLNEAARDALKQFLFSPAEVEGQKVSVRIVYIYRFKLESR